MNEYNDEKNLDLRNEEIIDEEQIKTEVNEVFEAAGESVSENIINETETEGFKAEPNTAYENIFDQPEKSTVILTDEKKSGSSFLKRAAAVAASVVVLAASVATGCGVGNYFYKNGGVVAASGSDISLGTSSGDELPIIYTANYNSISEVFKAVEASVVNISITVNTTNIWNQTYEATGSGSGIIYKVDGDDVYIATNNHVVDGASSVAISITGEEQIFATLVGKDAENDLAVIKVSKQALNDAGITDVKAVEFVSTDSVEIGETVLAIGNALGTGKSVTMGIISAKDKSISIDGKNLVVLQTDAAINPGNSGGALVNLDGQVIGINTAKTGSSTVEGTGYAIPSYTAVTILDQLIENGTVEKPYLGVVCFTITDNFRQMYNIDITGVFVQEVNSGSAAEKAGIRATDIITAVDGTTVTSQADLQNIIASHSVGDSITISFIRNGRESMEVTAVLENYNEF
ncbi:MAG: trypsin-like peptidase domain-containing protein [Clostridiales bacterium]|nr:trypsin-like peptidase domain-containing protein [Clostridiales bacterium]